MTLIKDVVTYYYMIAFIVFGFKKNQKEAIFNRIIFLKYYGIVIIFT